MVVIETSRSNQTYLDAAEASGIACSYSRPFQLPRLSLSILTLDTHPAAWYPLNFSVVDR